MSTKRVNTPHPSWTVTMQPCRDALIMHIERASFQHSWYSAVKATKNIPRPDGHGLHTVNGKVGGILDRLVFHAARPGWNPGEATPKGRYINYQEYTELENLDGSRFEADIYMSKLDMHSVTLKVRDILVWQPSMAPALVLWLGKIHPSYNDKQ